MSIPGPNTTFHTIRLMHGMKSISRQLNNNYLSMACVKRAQTCQPLIIDDLVTIAID